MKKLITLLLMLYLSQFVWAAEDTSEVYGPYGFNIKSIINDTSDERINKMIERGFLIDKNTINNFVLPKTYDAFVNKYATDRIINPQLPTSMIYYKSDNADMIEKIKKDNRILNQEGDYMLLQINVLPVVGEIVGYSLRGNVKYLGNNPNDIRESLIHLYTNIFPGLKPVCSKSFEDADLESIITFEEWKVGVKKGNYGIYRCMEIDKDDWRRIFARDMKVTISKFRTFIDIKVENNDRSKDVFNLIGGFNKAVQTKIGKAKAAEGL